MKTIIGGIAIFLWGLFMFLFPHKFWELFESWKSTRSAEPSKFYLIEVRAGGTVCMVVGLTVFVCSFFVA